MALITRRRLLILVGSPRRNANSATMAAAVDRGARASGTDAEVCFIDDYVEGFLRDCRRCRGPDGRCTIEDRYAELFLEKFLAADGWVLCTPIYWYGVSAQAKAFFDRSFCYYAASYPQAQRVLQQLTGKTLGLALSSEESYPGAALAVIHQIQEYARYTHSRFVGVVHGVGNRRGEVASDPAAPLEQCERLGREFFTRHYSDYRLDSPRETSVWRT